jgi:hypothetical protein
MAKEKNNITLPSKLEQAEANTKAKPSDTIYKINVMQTYNNGRPTQLEGSTYFNKLGIPSVGITPI